MNAIHGIDAAVWDTMTNEAKAAVSAAFATATKAAAKTGNVTFKVTTGGNPRKDRNGQATGEVTPGGAIGVYGLNARFPITLYLSQITALMEAMATLVAFVNTNAASLTVKDGEDRAALLNRFNAAVAKFKAS